MKAALPPNPEISCEAADAYAIAGSSASSRCYAAWSRKPLATPPSAMHECKSRKEIMVVSTGLDPQEPESLDVPHLTEDVSSPAVLSDDIPPPIEWGVNIPQVAIGKRESMAPHNQRPG